MCSSLSSRVCKTIGIGRNGDDDEDDPAYVTGVDVVCDVDTTGGTGPVVCSAANLTFFKSGTASKTGCEILSCASLTRALRSASEDMAWMKLAPC